MDDLQKRRLRLVAANTAALLLTAGIQPLIKPAAFDAGAGGILNKYAGLFLSIPLDLSFWIAAYTVAAVFCIYSLIPVVWSNADRGMFIDRIGPLFIISCAMNLAWAFAWHFGWLPVSSGLITLSFGLQIAVYVRLKIGASRTNRLEKYFVHAPFSLFLGWISLAAILNITAHATYLNLDGIALNPQVPAVAWLFLVFALAIFMLVKRADIFFSLTTGWALLQVFIKSASLEPASYHYMTLAAGMGMVMVLGAVIYMIIAGQVNRGPVHRLA